MKILKLIAAILFGLFLFYGGINHFMHPEFYNPFIPDFLPKLWVNYATGLVEIILGAGLCIPACRRNSALGAMVLMIAFTPIHLLDLWSETPAIGSHKAAWIRIGVQGLFIAWMFWLSRPRKIRTKTSAERRSSKPNQA
ncbi:MAG: DoxX family membrane protein [Verrucomicrobia bacterium]|nr:DoxX family membrane protein [Verrucomicrobiota bacterium]MDA1067372.1 DoxX family membrane protein [Verrucomicrobiota bacterium]